MSYPQVVRRWQFFTTPLRSAGRKKWAVVSGTERHAITYLKKKLKKTTMMLFVTNDKRDFQLLPTVNSKHLWQGAPCPKAVSVVLHHTYIKKWGQAIIEISHYHNNPWRFAAGGQWLLSIYWIRRKMLYRLVFHFLQTGGCNLDTT